MLYAKRLLKIPFCINVLTIQTISMQVLMQKSVTKNIVDSRKLVKRMVQTYLLQSQNTFIFCVRQKHLVWVWTFQIFTILYILHHLQYLKITYRKLDVQVETIKKILLKDLSSIYLIMNYLQCVLHRTRTSIS